MKTMKTPAADLRGANLAALVLVDGAGSGAPGDRDAIQEIRAWLGLYASSLVPDDCVCPVVGAAAIRCNDHSGVARAALVPLLPRLIGSRGSAALTRRRQWAVADTVIRESTPARLAAIAARPGLSEEQREQILGWRDRLAAIPAVIDDASRAAARVVVGSARAAAAAAAAYDVDDDAFVALNGAYAYAYAACACDTHAVAPADAADAVADAHAYIELIERLLAMTDGAPAPDDPAADLRGAILSGVDLSGRDLCGANLCGVDLSGVDLSGANFERADLSGADLRRADLSGANFEGANFEGADLRRADLSGAILEGANLTGANLSGANRSGVDPPIPGWILTPGGLLVSAAPSSALKAASASLPSSPGDA